MKLQKSPGVDKIQYERLRYAGQQFLVLITKLFSAIIAIGNIPTMWKKGLAMPVYKGVSKPSHKYESYRLIALLCSYYKLL